MKSDRLSLFDNVSLDGSTKLNALVKTIKIKNIINSEGKASMAYFIMCVNGIRRVEQLNLTNLNKLRPFIKASMYNSCCKSIAAPNIEIGANDLELYFSSKQWKPLGVLKAKEIRQTRTAKDQICLFKSGMILTPLESATWCLKLKKLTSVRHKTILLRIAHGDIYTNERLFRFGLKDNPNCGRCNEIENLEHKFWGCAYVKKLWDKIQEKIGVPLPSQTELSPFNHILGGHKDSDLTTMSIKAETLLRILYIRDSDNFLRCPKALTKTILKHLEIMERNPEIKNELQAFID